MPKQSRFPALKSRWMSLSPGLRLSLFIAINVAIGGLLAWMDGISPRAIVASFLIMSLLAAIGFAVTLVLRRVRR